MRHWHLASSVPLLYVRDGELEPFAPFPRPIINGLPIVFVTRGESGNDLFLTGTLGARRSVCPDQVVLYSRSKRPESGPSQPIPARTSGAREQAVGGPNRRRSQFRPGPVHPSRFRSPSFGPWLWTVESPFTQVHIFSSSHDGRSGLSRSFTAGASRCFDPGGVAASAAGLLSNSRSGDSADRQVACDSKPWQRRLGRPSNSLRAPARRW